MGINETLKNLGITTDEYAVYTAISANPPATISELVVAVKMHRPAVYKILDSLKDKELVFENKIGPKFIAASPDKFMSMARNMKEKFESDIIELENHIEYLKTVKSKTRGTNLSEIQIIRGGNTTDELDKMILNESKPLFGFSYMYHLDVCFNFNKKGELVENEYLEVVLRLTDKFVFPTDQKTLRQIRKFIKDNPFLKNKWQPRWIPKDELDFKINFYAFGDKVAFGLGNYDEKDYLAYIINNKEIAYSMTNLVQYVWNNANLIY